MPQPRSPVDLQKVPSRDVASLFARMKAEADLRYESVLAKKPMWPAPYDQYTPESAKAFVKDLCYSYEETSGVTMKAPDEEFLYKLIDEWFDTKNSGTMLAVEKSRRLWVTWLFCALDVWDCGMRRIGVAQVGNTDDKSNDFTFRCWFLYEEIRKRNSDWELPELQKWGGNIATRRLEMIAFPNGSLIEGLHADSAEGEVFRSKGFARVKLEEASSYRYLASVLTQASAVTSGPPQKPGEPKKPGGHLVLVCNASTNDDWQIIKEVPQGVQVAFPYGAYVSSNGARVIRVHYSADRQKTPEWAKLERSRGGYTERNWKREFELDDTLHDGDPVYRDFVDIMHCPLSLKRASWQTDTKRKRIYVLGLDCGNTLWPAGVLIEIACEYGWQTAAIQEWTFDGNTPMSRAIPQILDGYERQIGGKTFKYRGLREILPGHWDDVRWVGDESVASRQGASGLTSQQIASNLGVQIRPVTNNVDARLRAVDWLLTDLIEGDAPRFFLSGHDCPMLLRGFQGAYKCMDIPGKSEGHDRRIPEKNVYSHVHDGLQYAAMATMDICRTEDGSLTRNRRRRG